MKDQELDSVFKDLYGMVCQLRVENEVNKVLIHSLMIAILQYNKKLTEECLESITFVSEMLRKQIREQWSENEATLFEDLIEQETKRILQTGTGVL
jgi:hypothetical protein